jgi:hypothetical protein
MTDAARDYSETLFLPTTDFPMRAGLPQKEPDILKRWERIGLYRRLREEAKGLVHHGSRFLRTPHTPLYVCPRLKDCARG